MRIEGPKTVARSSTAADTKIGGAASGVSNAGNVYATAIISAFTHALPKLFDDAAQKAALKKPSVNNVARPAADGNRAGGRITITYALADAQTARRVIDSLGPVDEENLITDNMSLPETVDQVDFAARENKAVFTIDWTEPPGPQHKRVMEAMSGNVSRLIGDIGKGQGMRISALGPTVDSTQQSSARFTYEITRDGDFASADVVKKLAAALDLQQQVQLPAFVRNVSATAKAYELIITISW